MIKQSKTDLFMKKIKIMYNAREEQGKLSKTSIEAAATKITKKVETIKENFKATLEVNTARIDACERKICFMEEQIKIQNMTVNGFTSAQTT